MAQRVPLCVREATRTDAGALIALWSASLDHADSAALPSQFGVAPWREPSVAEAEAAVDHHLSSSDTRLWVAVAGEEIVGVSAALWRTMSPIHLTRMVVITELEVLPSWRRRSVASLLLASATAWAEELDSEIVVAFAGHRQRESARFLTKLGFAQVVTARVVQASVLRARLAARAPQARGTASRGTARTIVVRRALRRRHRARSTAIEAPESVDSGDLGAP